MKVLIATPFYYPEVGGLELYAQHIAGELHSLGWEVHVVTSGPARGQETHDNITVHRLKSALRISNTPFNFAWRSQVKRLIRDIKPDVINVHAPVPSMALVVSAAAGRIPVVVTYHAGSMKKGSQPQDLAISVYERFFLPRMLQKSAAIISASQFVTKQFLKAWSKKTVTITPGVDAEKFTPNPDKVVGGRVLFVGDFRDPRKGLSYLIDAVYSLPSSTLHVVGSGEGQSDNQIKYMGVQTGAALSREFQEAEVFVLPSTTEAESFGMVLVEAMASGVPVIGTTAGGMKYVIQDGITGTLVPPKNVLALKDAIQSILSDKKLHDRYAHAGREEALRSYSWQLSGAATNKVLTEATLG